MIKTKRLILNTLELMGITYKSKIEQRKENIDFLFKTTIYPMDKVRTEYDSSYAKLKDHRLAFNRTKAILMQ